MKTYNFYIIFGEFEFQIEVDAYNQEDALTIMENEYPREKGYVYFLI